MKDAMDANRPKSKEGIQYHIQAKKGDLPRYVLMPGDPDRVVKIGETWDSYEKLARHREYQSIRGKYSSEPIGALSTGIGAPSAAIAVEELAEIGVDTMIRVGSTGTIAPGVECGDLIINTGAVRFDGTTSYYVTEEYPAVAHHEMVTALIEACEHLGYRYHVGIAASTSSFYTGQGRPGFGGYTQSWVKDLIPDLQKAKVLNIEMETASIFTLASLFEMRAGSVCTVFANRITDTFQVTGENRAIHAANEAVRILSSWDRIKEENGKRYMYPSLHKEE